jgi:formate dehydrogenase subunit gamma
VGLEDGVPRNGQFITGSKKMKSGGNAMQSLTAPLCIVLVLGFLAVAATASPSAAQVQSVNPTKNAVSEEQLLQHFKTIRGLSTIPDTKSYTLMQPAGRDWRYFHEVALRWIGGIAILGMLGLLVVFYLSPGHGPHREHRAGDRPVFFRSARQPQPAAPAWSAE